MVHIFHKYTALFYLQKCTPTHSFNKSPANSVFILNQLNYH